MLGDIEPTFELLFEQLGLASDAASIDQFIKTHQIAADVRLVDAPFWNQGQREFLSQQLNRDSQWAMIVDGLNEQLHQDSQSE